MDFRKKKKVGPVSYTHLCGAGFSYGSGNGKRADHAVRSVDHYGGCPCGGTDDRAFGYDHESGNCLLYTSSMFVDEGFGSLDEDALEQALKALLQLTEMCIRDSDPFAKLDQTGVGKLMETAIKLGKPVNPKLPVGICGEHGGDPVSYTHLDVYKRQCEDLPEYSDADFEELLNKIEGGFFPESSICLLYTSRCV